MCMLAGVRSVASTVDALGDEVCRLADRVTRSEIVIEIVRPDGSVLRIAPAPGQTDQG